ncbi:hypothetical protein J1614_011420 [Plenodomus biglobosus]|nr:hypothetical protein J1614_011420 [Plenodomus biglobosus]
MATPTPTTFPTSATYENSTCDSPYVWPHHLCQSNSIARDEGRNRKCQGFICTQCLNPPQPPLASLYGTSDQLLTHSTMYEIAHKYAVVGLKRPSRGEVQPGLQTLLE